MRKIITLAFVALFLGAVPVLAEKPPHPVKPPYCTPQGCVYP